MGHQENFDEERWLISEIATQSQNDEEEEEEALSLSDLPLIHQWRKENRNDKNNNDNSNNNDFSTKEEDEEFDFCSHSKESEMCAADELFFKGQILPLRHSVSSEKGLLQNYDGGGGYRRRSISRSDSMDHYYSSRSSSMSSSHQSSSSGSSSATTTAAARRNPKLPPRIHFHTHPSPSPRLHFPSSRHGGAAVANHRNSIKKSSIWNVLRLGLVTPPPPEITFQDLKARSGNSGSRNSTSSNSSGGASKKKKMMRPRILGGGGCKCAADAVAPRVVIIKRSASEGDAAVELHDRSAAEKLTSKAAAKKHLSQHRTFEWLKQLSVEAAAADQS